MPPYGGLPLKPRPMGADSLLPTMVFVVGEITMVSGNDFGFVVGEITMASGNDFKAGLLPTMGFVVGPIQSAARQAVANTKTPAIVNTNLFMLSSSTLIYLLPCSTLFALPLQFY
jgi:hypothetical protein